MAIETRNKLGLIPIVSPELTSSRFGEDIRKRFDDIDDNFKKVSSIDLVRGATGDSAILETIPLDEYLKLENLRDDLVKVKDSTGHTPRYWINRIKIAILKYFGHVTDADIENWIVGNGEENSGHDLELDNFDDPFEVVSGKTTQDKVFSGFDVADNSGRSWWVTSKFKKGMDPLTLPEILQGKKLPNAYNAEKIGIWSLFGDVYDKNNTIDETSQDYNKNGCHQFPVIPQAGSITFINKVHNEIHEHISSLAYVYHDPRFVVSLSSIDADEYKNAEDMSCVLYWTPGENGEDGDFKVVQAFPTLYYDDDIGQFCWKINGQKTGLIARGPAGADGSSSTMWITMVDPDEVLSLDEVPVIDEYQVQRFLSNGNGNNWKKFKYNKNDREYAACDGSPTIVFKVDKSKFYDLYGINYGYYFDADGNPAKFETLDGNAGEIGGDGGISTYHDLYLYYTNHPEIYEHGVPVEKGYWLTTMTRSSTIAQYTDPDIDAIAGHDYEIITVSLTDGNKISMDIDLESLLEIIKNLLPGQSFLKLPVTDPYIGLAGIKEGETITKDTEIQEYHTQFAHSYANVDKDIDNAGVEEAEEYRLNTDRIDDNLVYTPVTSMNGGVPQGINLQAAPSLSLMVSTLEKKTVGSQQEDEKEEKEKPSIIVTSNTEKISVELSHIYYANITSVTAANRNTIDISRIGSNLTSGLNSFVSAKLLSEESKDIYDKAVRAAWKSIERVNSTSEIGRIEEHGIDSGKSPYINFQYPLFVWVGGDYTILTRKPIPTTDALVYKGTTLINPAAWAIRDFKMNWNLKELREELANEEANLPYNEIKEVASRLMSLLYTVWVEGGIASPSGVFDSVQAAQANFENIFVQGSPINNYITNTIGDSVEYMDNFDINRAFSDGVGDKGVDNDRPRP